MQTSKIPDAVSYLVLIRALNRQTDVARQHDKLQRADLLDSLFRNYLGLRNQLNSRFEEALSQSAQFDPA